MLGLCKYFEVVKDIDPENLDGFVVEDCSDSYSVLESYYIICPNDNILAIKNWIRENIRTNSEHCITMLDTSPIVAMKLLISLSSINSYTDEIVNDCGGIDSFFDKYAGKIETKSSGYAKEDLETNELEEEIEELDTLAFDVPVKQEEIGSGESDAKSEYELNKSEETDEDAATYFNQFSDKKIRFLTGITLEDGKPLVLTLEDFKVIAKYVQEVEESGLYLDSLSKEDILQSKDMESAKAIIDEISPNAIKEFIKYQIETSNDLVDYLRLTRFFDGLLSFITERYKKGDADEF